MLQTHHELLQEMLSFVFPDERQAMTTMGTLLFLVSNVLSTLEEDDSGVAIEVYITCNELERINIRSAIALTTITWKSTPEEVYSPLV